MVHPHLRELEGLTLGNRHQHYNNLVKEAIASNKQFEPGKLNNQENDVENLLKIDIASINKNVEYIIEVLKNDDMLYVSRAIKQCTWLITDKQYSYIINPKYLHSQLFPHMTSKACNKLMLHIRLYLKDETRVEEFYDYIKEKDLKKSFKWLPNCSVAFIEKQVEKYNDQLNESHIKRLCKRSFAVLEIYVQKLPTHCRSLILEATMFLVHTNAKKYLDLLEPIDQYDMPHFKAKHTHSIMKKCRERILNNIEKFAKRINTEAFASYLKKDDIQEFLLKHIDNKKLRSWFNYDNVKHFIKYMPKEGKFEFLKKVFIDKAYTSVNDEGRPEPNSLESAVRDYSCRMKCGDAPPSSSANIYRWYRFASFDVAYPEVKKLLSAESSPMERSAMLAVLLSCAGRNPQHIQTLLSFYRDKHINEPFKFKLEFVNNIISKTVTYKYDEKAWNVLNDIFYSMEMYMETDSNVLTQTCTQSIILYKILHDEQVPEIIEKKFIFNTMQKVQIKLKEEEKEKIFKYLCNFIATKIQNRNITSEKDLQEVIQLLKDVFTFFVDWKKELSDYPWVLNKIRELIKIKTDYSWSTDFSSLYINNKTWRKLMFDESLVLSPSEEVCLNALKHGPELLSRHMCEVEALCRNDAVSLRRLLGKLRVYWPQSLAGEWTASYLGRLEQTGGYKALTRGICFLLPQKLLIDVFKKYAPTEIKINWTEDDELLLNLRKHFAKNMYLARPQPQPDIILLYAHGDYLQYALPSLNAIIYNMSSEKSREHISKILDAPVSLQKHGIRLAFTKLDSEELMKKFPEIWATTKNSSTRAVLFKHTFDLLCREKKPLMIEQIWELLALFIDNLTYEENKTIYVLLGKVGDVPLSVRAKFCMKSYRYLKSLPAKANCESIVSNIIKYTKDMMEYLNPDFAADVLKEGLDKKFTAQRYGYTPTISSFLLCAKDEESQMQRYEDVLVPLLDRCLPLWKVKIRGSYFVRENVNNLLRQLWSDFEEFVFKKRMVFPVKMFTDILKKLEDGLSVHESYIFLRSWKLSVTLITMLESQKELLEVVKDEESDSSCGQFNRYQIKRDKRWDEMYYNICSDYVESCLQLLKEDINTFYPSVYTLFARALANSMCSALNKFQLKILKSMLEREDFVPSYLVVLKIVPGYIWHQGEEKKMTQEICRIIYLHPSPEVKMHYCRLVENLVPHLIDCTLDI